MGLEFSSLACRGSLMHVCLRCLRHREARCFGFVVAVAQRDSETISNIQYIALTRSSPQHQTKSPPRLGHACADGDPSQSPRHACERPTASWSCYVVMHWGLLVAAQEPFAFGLPVWGLFSGVLNIVAASEAAGLCIHDAAVTYKRDNARSQTRAFDIVRLLQRLSHFG